MSKSLQTPWYKKTIDALQLAGMSESTQESHARAVRMLIEHFEKDPRQITEGELHAYFLYRRNETRWSASTLKSCYCALKFFTTVYSYGLRLQKALFSRCPTSIPIECWSMSNPEKDASVSSAHPLRGAGWRVVLGRWPVASFTSQ